MNGEELLQLFIFHSYCMELQGYLEFTNISYCLVFLFVLFRENPTTPQEIFATEESIRGSNFDGSKPETIFITHGFSSNSEGWCTAMKDGKL